MVRASLRTRGQLEIIDTNFDPALDTPQRWAEVPRTLAATRGRRVIGTAWLATRPS
jgi:hypothetical protein